jgi:DegV family protein with EDD domain
MGKIKIITDSTCDLPEEWFKLNDVEVMKLEILVDGKSREITSDEVLEEMKKGKKVTTSQITPDEFEKAYSTILKTYDSILSVHLSSKLSGTYSSAMLAAQHFKGKVEVIDSLTTTSALGAMVAKAVELSNSGDLEDSAKKMKIFAQNVKTIFGIQTVDNLIKGGRAYTIAGKLVTLLNVKPILKGEDGEIKFHKIVLGFPRVLRGIVDYINSFEVEDGRIYIAHTHAEEAVEYVRSKVNLDCIIAPTNPVISINAGAGAILVGFLTS